VNVSIVPSIPLVSVNESNLSLEFPIRFATTGIDSKSEPLQAFAPFSGGLSYYGRVLIERGAEANLFVTHERSNGSQAEAEAAVPLPEPFVSLSLSNEGYISSTTDVTAE
jgi:hypothetical protein